MPTTTTTTTTPQPTGVHTFQCWNNDIPPIYPLLKPWPCCGLTKHPSSIYGTITYSSTGGSIPYPNGNGVMNYCGNVTLNQEIKTVWAIPENGKCPNDQFFTYMATNVPVQIYFTYPCWTVSQFYGSKGLFGFSSNFNQNIISNGGGCTYNKKTGGWDITGGYQGSYYYGDITRGCTVTVKITGIG